VSISRPRILLVAVAAVALLLLAGVAYLVWHHPALPAPGSEKYEQYVEAFDVGIAALDADVPQIAQESLTKAIDLVPGEPAAWADRGLLLIRDGRLDEALRDLHEAERLAPENAAIQQLLGIADQRRGQLAAAAEYFQTAIKLEPKNVMALYRLAVVIDQQQGPDSDAEYQRLMDRILAVQPNNLFILQSKLRVALRRGDHAAARKTVEQLKQLSAEWSPQAKKQLTELDRALTDPAAKVELAKALPLMNLMRAEQDFKRDAAAVDADDKLAETALETLVRLPPPRHTPAEPDTGLTFTARPLDDTLTGRWDVLAPIWLNKGEPPAMVVASKEEVRIVGPWHGQEAAPKRKALPSIALGPNGLLPIDWNNDFRTDLLLAGRDGLRFYEQQADSSFKDVTAKTGLSDEVLHGDYFAAWAADIDLDGDLDIILARTTGSPLLLQNNFDGTFQSRPIFEDVNGARAFVWADFDNDGAPDAALLDAGLHLHVYANERSGHFEPWPVKPPSDIFWALTVADINHDGILSLVALRSDWSVVRIADKDKRSAWETSELLKYEQSPGFGSVRLLTADLDNNGVPDLVVVLQGAALASLGKAPDASRIWLGDGAAGRFIRLKDEFPGNISAAVDLDGKGRLDLVGLDREGRPFRFVNSGKKDYRWQVIRPVAKVGPDLGDNRINSYGIGGEMEVRSGSFFVKQPIATPEVHFGLGTRSHVDVLRIQWPNGTSQFEFPKQIDSTLEAEQRLKGSCPFLFTWNGERFVFVADFMWITPLGMFINAQDTGGLGPTTEWVTIRGDQLVPRDGYYEVRVNANLWETHFFDHLSLVAVDHLTDTEMFVNERFSPAAAGPEMQITSPPRPIARARDQDGKDVTDLVAAIDGRYLDHFQRGTYQGLAKDHWVEIELPEEADHSPLTAQPSPLVGHPGADAPGSVGHSPLTTHHPPTYLLATGWIHPTDSSINFALAQGTHDRPRGLTLEIPDGKGGWKVVRDDIGFPAGKNKTMVIRLDGIDGPGVPRRFRLRTNMEIYWDALRIAEGRADSPITKTQLLAETADLQYRGILEMTESNRSSPELPNYDHIVAHGQHWRDLIGYHTRYGDVRELLAGIDDRYVIACGGDEIVLRFKVPAGPRPGWKRDFVWVSDGWVKDGDLNTRFGKTVLPLPSHDAKSYDTPPGRLEDDPVYKKHSQDWQNYHTRYVTPEFYERGLRGYRGDDTNPKR
jgi:tetratricopeptide (TPR) repeat protein